MNFKNWKCRKLKSWEVRHRRSWLRQFFDFVALYCAMKSRRKIQSLILTPRWRYLNLARLPIPPYLHIKFLSSKFYTARTFRGGTYFRLETYFSVKSAAWNFYTAKTTEAEHFALSANIKTHFCDFTFQRPNYYNTMHLKVKYTFFTFYGIYRKL